MKSSKDYLNKLKETIHVDPDLSFSDQRALSLNKNNTPVTLIVKVTNKCNLTCPYCYNQKKAVNREDMSLEMVAQIARKFKGRINTWTWHGGEPTLMGINYFKEAHRIVRDINGDTKFAIQTHGGLINEDWITFFKEENMHPGLSFDGYQNDYTRKNTRTFLEKRALLKEHGINSGAIMVITEDTIDQINENYELFKELGMSGMFNQAFEVHDVSHQKTKENKDANKVAEKIIDHFEYWIHDTNNPTDVFLASRYLNMLLEGGRTLCEHSNCTGRWIGIYPNGDLYPCGRDWPEDLKLGNINDFDDVGDIIDSPLVKKYMQDVHDMIETHCKDCPFRTICNGGCPGDNHTSKGFTEPNSTVCNTTKKVLTYIYNRLQRLDLEKEITELNPLFVRILQETGFRDIHMIKEAINETEKRSSD